MKTFENKELLKIFETMSTELKIVKEYKSLMLGTHPQHYYVDKYLSSLKNKLEELIKIFNTIEK